MNAIIILRREYPNEVELYHSKQHKNARVYSLRRFEEHDTRILISCKTLDEGLNVTETDVGIIVSSTSSNRQRLQRLGRALRKNKRNRLAYFYYLYAENTSEEDEMLSESIGLNGMSKLANVIDLRYNDLTSEFTNYYYDKLLAMVLNSRAWDEDSESEFMRNARLGLITCDWLAEESECMKRLKSSTGRAKRNYYIAMLLLSKARSTLQCQP